MCAWLGTPGSLCLFPERTLRIRVTGQTAPQAWGHRGVAPVTDVWPLIAGLFTVLFSGAAPSRAQQQPAVAVADLTGLCPHTCGGVWARGSERAQTVTRGSLLRSGRQTEHPGAGSVAVAACARYGRGIPSAGGVAQNTRHDGRSREAGLNGRGTPRAGVPRSTRGRGERADEPAREQGARRLVRAPVPTGGCALQQRQPHGEQRPLPLRGGDRATATGRRDQFLAEEQAQAQTTLRRAIRVRHLREPGEERGQLVSRDAPPVILHLPRGLAAHAPQPHVDGRRAWRVDALVGQQEDCAQCPRPPPPPPLPARGEAPRAENGRRPVSGSGRAAVSG